MDDGPESDLLTKANRDAPSAGASRRGTDDVGTSGLQAGRAKGRPDGTAEHDETEIWRAERLRRRARNAGRGVLRIWLWCIATVLLLVVLGEAINFASDSMQITRAAAPRQR